MKYILKIYLTKYILDKNKKGRLVFFIEFLFLALSLQQRLINIMIRSYSVI